MACLAHDVHEETMNRRARRAGGAPGRFGGPPAAQAGQRTVGVGPGDEPGDSDWVRLPVRLRPRASPCRRSTLQNSRSTLDLLFSCSRGSHLVDGVTRGAKGSAYCGQSSPYLLASCSSHGGRTTVQEENALESRVLCLRCDAIRAFRGRAFRRVADLSAQPALRATGTSASSCASVIASPVVSSGRCRRLSKAC